jgi:hypothetical protein
MKKGKIIKEDKCCQVLSVGDEVFIIPKHKVSSSWKRTMGDRSDHMFVSTEKNHEFQYCIKADCVVII